MVSPRVAAGPEVVAVPVADMGAVAGRTGGGDLGTSVEGVGAVGHDGAGRARPGPLARIEVRPRAGDTVGFGDKISGDETGVDRGTCIVIGRGLLCTVEVQLSKGTLSVQ